MKIKYIIIYFLLAISYNANAQWVLQTLGSWDSNGRPNYLEPLKDTVTSDDISRINGPNGYIPAGHSVPDSHPDYIQTTDIHIDVGDSIYITFVTESAGHLNSLGFYTYPDNNKPATKNDIDTVTLIFPNSSNNNANDLSPGDKINLGFIPSNTVIGWVLFDNSWTSDSTTFVDRLPTWSRTWYSDHIYNPGERSHTVLFKDTIINKWILGFEDLDLGDKDYSDVVYYVSGFNTNPTSTLPISLLDINFDTKTRLLSWHTATESNNHYFILKQLDADGNSFNTSIIPGAGTTNTVQSYSYVIDNKAKYIELYQKDYDGKINFIKRKYVGIKVPSNIILYPNPSHNRVSIKGKVDKIEVYNLQGQHQSFDYHNGILSGLKTGSYIININGFINKRLIIL